jgi:hypothetical protein
MNSSPSKLIDWKRAALLFLLVVLLAIGYSINPSREESENGSRIGFNLVSVACGLMLFVWFNWGSNRSLFKLVRGLITGKAHWLSRKPDGVLVGKCHQCKGEVVYDEVDGKAVAFKCASCGLSGEVIPE